MGAPGTKTTTLYPDCSVCCGVVPVGCGVGSFTCLEMPAQWTLQLGNDFTNGSCSDGSCATLDGTSYTLTHVAAGLGAGCTAEVSNGCYWVSSNFTFCTIPSMCWVLRFLMGITNVWELQLRTVGTFLEWATILPQNFNCLAANTFINPTWTPPNPLCHSASSATITPVA